KPLVLTPSERLMLLGSLSARFAAVAEGGKDDARPATYGTASMAFKVLTDHARAADAPFEPDVLGLIRLLENEKVSHYVSREDAKALNPLLEQKRIWESIWEDRLKNESYSESWL